MKILPIGRGNIHRQINGPLDKVRCQVLLWMFGPSGGRFHCRNQIEFILRARTEKITRNPHGKEAENMDKCKPNPSIRCTVTQCRNHCEDVNYCALDSITVVTHESDPVVDQCTDCQSFERR